MDSIPSTNFNCKCSLSIAQCRLNSDYFEAVYLHILDKVDNILSSNASLVSWKYSEACGGANVS